MSPYIAQIKDYKQVKIFDKGIIKSSIMVLDKQRQQEIFALSGHEYGKCDRYTYCSIR